jgi:hypothetical protein
MLGQLNHSLENLAVLREKEIFRAQFFDGRVEGMIIEKHGAKDAAFRLEIVGKRAFNRSACAGHSLYLRLGLFGMQGAEFGYYAPEKDSLSGYGDAEESAGTHAALRS